MAKPARNKKYLVLDDVRVSYRKKDDSIHLLSTDEDFPSGFHLPIQKGTHVEEQLRELLTEKDFIDPDADVLSNLPKKAAWSDYYVQNSMIAPSFFPIGLGNTGGVPMIEAYGGEKTHVLGFDLQGLQSGLMKRAGIKNDHGITASPHALIVGGTGGGKSVILRSIMHAAILRSDYWDVVGIDLKKVEMNQLKDRIKHVTTLDQAAIEFEAAEKLMMDRYERLGAMGLNNYLDFPEPEKALLIVVDELCHVLQLPEPKAMDELQVDSRRMRILSSISEIAKLGRAAGVHLILFSQRIDGDLLPGETKANIGVRIVCGRVNQSVQIEVLDEAKPEYNVGTERGRFYMKIYGHGQPGQAFFKDPHDLPRVNTTLKDNLLEVTLPKKAVWSDDYLDLSLAAPSFFPLGITSESGVPMVEAYSGESAQVLGVDLQGLQVEKSQGEYSFANVAHHVLIAGHPGSGKSVMVRNFIRAAAQRPNHWNVVAVDLSQRELLEFRHPAVTVSSLEHFAAELHKAEILIAERSKELKRSGLNSFTDLPDHGKRLLIAVDDFYSILKHTGLKTEEGRRDDELRFLIRAILISISELGRPVGVHLVLAGQRVDRRFFPDALNENLTARILCGESDPEIQQDLFGRADAFYNVGSATGRFCMMTYGGNSIGQGFISQ